MAHLLHVHSPIWGKSICFASVTAAAGQTLSFKKTASTCSDDDSSSNKNTNKHYRPRRQFDTLLTDVSAMCSMRYVDINRLALSPTAVGKYVSNQECEFLFTGVRAIQNDVIRWLAHWLREAVFASFRCAPFVNKTSLRHIARMDDRWLYHQYTCTWAEEGAVSTVGSQ